MRKVKRQTWNIHDVIPYLVLLLECGVFFTYPLLFLLLFVYDPVQLLLLKLELRLPWQIVLRYLPHLLL